MRLRRLKLRRPARSDFPVVRSREIREIMTGSHGVFPAVKNPARPGRRHYKFGGAERIHWIYSSDPWIAFPIQKTKHFGTKARTQTFLATVPMGKFKSDQP